MVTMTLKRVDSEELPPLDDFIDSDTEGQLNMLDDDSDDFDAIGLLSQPIFGDSDDELDITEKGSNDFDSIDSLPHPPEMGQSNFEEPQRTFDSFTGHSQNVDALQGHGTFEGSGVGPHDSSRSGDNNHELHRVDYQIQDMQRSILQVQQQIEQVQLGTSNMHNGGFASPQQKQSGSVQNHIDIQTLMSQAGMNRSPPGRSISMPIRRNQMQGGPMNQPAFMMQKPMEQLLEQSVMMGNSQENTGSSRFSNNMQGAPMNMMQLQQQQAMMGNSQGSSASRGSARSNPNSTGGVNMNHRQMIMNKNSMDGPLQSPSSSSLGMMQKSLIDRQRGMMSTPDSQFSHPSPSHHMPQAMNRIQGNMMQGINQPFAADESDRGAMGNMQMVANMQAMNQGYAMENPNPNMMNNVAMMNNMNNMNHMNNMSHMNNMNNMGNMHGFNQGFVTSNSDINTMNNMQGFNVDASGGSAPNEMSGMGMNPNMMMMMQQQQMVNFGDGDAVQHQNSMPSNVSSNLVMMPNQSQEMMTSGADFELAQMQRSFQGQGVIPGSAGQQMSLGQAPSSGLSMERLVEKMQRSAVSRNLVKQMSGSSVPLNGASRTVSRSHSGLGIARTNSKTGRSLARANSGRSVQRTSSGRQLEGGELPVRRLAQDSKHRIKELAISNSVHRGVVRHKSQSAVIGGSNSKVVSIDGNEVGMF